MESQYVGSVAVADETQAAAHRLRALREILVKLLRSLDGGCEAGTDTLHRRFVGSPAVGGIFQEIGGAATLSVLPAPDKNRPSMRSIHSPLGPPALHAGGAHPRPCALTDVGEFTARFRLAVQLLGRHEGNGRALPGCGRNGKRRRTGEPFPRDRAVLGSHENHTSW
jgi:hypothetical protein